MKKRSGNPSFVFPSTPAGKLAWQIFKGIYRKPDGLFEPMSIKESIERRVRAQKAVRRQR
jgi:hypothetical protein